MFDTVAHLQDPAFRNFTRLLLKLPEHTWGLDAAHYPAAFDVWDNESFRKALQEDDAFKMAEEAWQRQLRYVPWSIEVRPLPLFAAVTSPFARRSLASLRAGHSSTWSWSCHQGSRAGLAHQLSRVPHKAGALNRASIE